MSAAVIVEDENADAYSCRVRLDFDDPFLREPFETTLAIERMHSRTPRFGHSKDINKLIQGTNEEQKDYLKGLLGASFAFFLFFLLWMVIILVFQCLGPRKVGLLSARRQPRPTKPKKPKCAKEAAKPNEKEGPVRRKIPFQHNGIAAGYESPKSPSSKSTSVNGLKAIVQAPIKAPSALISKAREKKRQLEESRVRKRFERMDSKENCEEQEPQEEEEEDDEPASPGSKSHGQSIAATVPTTPGTTMCADSPEQHSNSSKKEQLDADKDAIAKYEKEHTQYKQLVEVQGNRIRRVRIGVGFSCIVIIISAVLFTVMSMDELTQSVQSAKQGLDQIGYVAQDAIETLDLYHQRQQVAKESTQKFILEVNDICPNVAPPCTNVTSADRVCDFSETPFAEELTTLFQLLDGTFDLLVGQLDTLESDLVELLGVLEKANTYYPKHFAWAFWVAAGSSLLLAILCLFILVGILLVSTKRHPNDDERLPNGFKWIRSWMVIPLFLLLTVIGWIFSMVVIVASIGSADMCIDSPDGPVLSILSQLQEEFVSVVYSYLVYYVQGCPAAQAPVELDQRIQILDKYVFPALQGLGSAILLDSNSSSISSGGEVLQDNWEAICGTSFSPFLAILGALDNQLCILTQTLVDVRLLFACDNWYPVYEETFHNAMCYHATSGLSWAAATQIVIVFFAMIILTLRVAYYELDEVVYDDKQDTFNGCCSSWKKKEDSDSDSDDDDDDDDDDDAYTRHTTIVNSLGGCEEPSQGP